MADGIILVPKNLKVPLVEQRKKRGFCKFHGFLGHSLSRCTRSRDSVQKALDEGRLKFGDRAKQPMQVDADPLKNAYSMYAEVVGINMVDISEELLAIETPAHEENLSTNVDEVAEDHHFVVKLVTEDQFAEKMKTAYLKAEEDLVDFLNRCKISNTHAKLCPRCSAIFDKEVAKSVEGFRPQPNNKDRWVNNRPKYGFNKRGVPYKMKFVEKVPHRNHQKTFNPPWKSPTDTWVFSGGKRPGFSTPTTKWVKRVATTPNQKWASNSKWYAYSNNNQGKHPMTKTQWRMYQCQKKADALKNITNVDDNKGKQAAVFEMVKKTSHRKDFSSFVNHQE